MKKYFILTISLLFISVASFAGKLVLIPVNETNSLENLFLNNELKIHYYCDTYVVATTENLKIEGAVLLDENAFAEHKQYAIVYCFNNLKNDYLFKTGKNGKMLHSGNNFLIMEIVSHEMMPAKNDGMVAIRNVQARLPISNATYPVITESNENVLNYLSQVSTDTLMSYIQTLQDFVTRDCQHPNIVNSRDWLKKKYEALNLEVTLHNFPYYNNDNVIAIQRGTEFPDEYVVCGAHYDSKTWYPQNPDIAPGADDDATGTAGILETARVLSPYNFKRSIIYCAFSGEEYGLYGSGYFAEKCAKEAMNIVGYFNLDMTGYLTEGREIHIDYIFPANSQPLADYSTNICSVYFPEIPIRTFSTLPWGDSDHTSFTNMGYRGVWPFEDIDEDSPFIHSNADTIGTSVNNPEQVNVFTQVNLACVATLAMYDVPMPLNILPPVNCETEFYQENYIRITWEAPETTSTLPIVQYNVYRDGALIRKLPATKFDYVDAPANSNNPYCYKITAGYGVLDGFESGFSNESCISLSGIREYNSKVLIYPNPANNELRITILDHKYKSSEIEIFDVSGRKQKTESSSLNNEGEMVFDISHFPAGIYFIKISHESVGKFIKE